MPYEMKKCMRIAATVVAASALAILAGSFCANSAYADEAQARALLKSMSDYMGKQNAISFDYDSNVEVVSRDRQKYGLASSGTITLNRPDKVHVTRTGGFADVELVSDGKTLTLFGKNAKAYAQAENPGSVDQLIATLRNKFQRPLPAADLLFSDAYTQLMPNVLEVKDLGDGVIRGQNCDHIAGRSKNADWQIWIAQGDRPYPCRFVITTSSVPLAPEYTLDIRSWKTGSEVAADPFKADVTGARKIETSELSDFNEVPVIFLVKK
jgi:hypothetical protein